MKSGHCGLDSKPWKEKVSLPTSCYLLSANKGVALVMTLILSLAGLVLATALIYFLMQSTAMSGAGKR